MMESRVGEPTWEIAERFYPRQGQWTEQQFEWLADDCPVPVTFDAGTVRFLADARRESSRGEPTWEAAEFCHPLQGEWTEADYFAVGDGCTGVVEFADGTLEFQALADFAHAGLHRFLFLLFHAHCQATGAGETFSGQLTVRGLPENRNREPDVLIARPGVDRGRRRYPAPRDVLASTEIVSPDPKDVERDHVLKRREYARGGIPEYWIVDATDPAAPFVLVLTLPDGATEYVEHGTFRPGETATSPALPGLTCDVAALFAAAEG